MWFGIIKRQALHQADVAPVKKLNAKICAFVTAWNGRGHPFAWTKTSTEILKKANHPTTSKTGP